MRVIEGPVHVTPVVMDVLQQGIPCHTLITDTPYLHGAFIELNGFVMNVVCHGGFGRLVVPLCCAPLSANLLIYYYNKLSYVQYCRHPCPVLVSLSS